MGSEVSKVGSRMQEMEWPQSGLYVSTRNGNLSLQKTVCQFNIESLNNITTEKDNYLIVMM